MFLFLAAVAAQSADAPTKVGTSQTAWVFATVGHSEWCPAGNVWLDLKSGKYAFTPRAARSVCNDATLERPVMQRRFVGGQLAAIRSAYARALSEGLENPACRDGGQPG